MAERLGISMPRILGQTRLGLLGTIRVTATVPLSFVSKAFEGEGPPPAELVDEMNRANVWTWAEVRNGGRWQRPHAGHDSRILAMSSSGELPDEGFSLILATARYALRCVPDRRGGGLLVIAGFVPRVPLYSRLLVARFELGSDARFDTHGLCTVVASQTRLLTRIREREIDHTEVAEREFITTARRYLEALQEHVRTATPRAPYALVDRSPARIRPPDGAPWPRAFARPGTLLQYGPEDGRQWTFAVVDASDDGDVLTLDAAVGDELGVSGIIQVRPNIEPLRRMREALDTIAMGTDEAHGRLLSALTRPESLPEVELDETIDAPPESDLQARAVALALATPDLALIHGPPGTGKTTVIARIITELVKQRGQRVLLVAPTHVALDNVLERVGDLPGVTAIRIGSRDNVDEQAHRFLLQHRSDDLSSRLAGTLVELTRWSGAADDPVVEIQREWARRLREDDDVGALLILNANLVCATPIGIAMAREFRDVDVSFDVMIVDEASKATITDFLVPAARARKWILVGDHRQLAPYADAEELAAVVAERIARAEIANVPTEWARDLSLALRAQFDSRMHPQAERIELKWRDFVEELAEPFAVDHDAFEEVVRLEKTSTAWREAYRAAKGRELAAGSAPPVMLRLGAELLEIRDLALPGVFEHLTRLPPSRSVALRTQHRMAPALAEFSAELVYPGGYPSAEETAALGLEIPGLEAPALWIDTAFAEPGRRYEHPRDRDWRGGDYTNELEVEVALELLYVCATWAVQCWRGDPKPGGRGPGAPFEIGIISFYLAQALRLRDAVFDRLLPGTDPWRRRWEVPAASGAPIDVHVSIVDRFQGREKDVAVICTTRSNPKGIRGHVDNLNRLNVAVTRARHKRIVIGDSTTLAGEPPGRPRAANDLLRRLYETSEKKKTWGRVLGRRR